MSSVGNALDASLIDDDTTAQGKNPARARPRSIFKKLARPFMTATMFATIATMQSDSFSNDLPTRFQALAAKTCPAASQADSRHAYIVFTGGQGRVATGLYLYTHDQNPNSVLYISGVDPNVTLANVLKVNSHSYLLPEQNRTIFNDHAGSTNANAIQTVMFLKNRCIDNVTLITSDYHMERARYVLGLALNDINFQPNMSYVSIDSPPLSWREQFEENVKTRAVRFFHGIGLL